MDDDTQPAHPADRLQAALERIARQASAPDPVAMEVTARLDSLIAQLRSALDKYDKKYDWVVYNDEAHGFNKDENKFDFYNRVDAFLAKNLAPRAAR